MVMVLLCRVISSSLNIANFAYFLDLTGICKMSKQTFYVASCALQSLVLEVLKCNGIVANYAIGI